MPTILNPIDRSNWRDALQLTVRADQQRFVAEVVPVAAIVLAKAYIRPGGMIWLPYAILVNAEMVGMLALAYPPETHNPCWMYHFFIDQAHQGKGFGKAGLAAFIQLVRSAHPSCEEIRLTVHPENERAQRLYAQAGFQPTGDILHNEPVYRLGLV
jgi:diamine N-acetyltransferase